MLREPDAAIAMDIILFTYACMAIHNISKKILPLIPEVYTIRALAFSTL